MICANKKCSCEFDPANRVSATALPGAMAQVKYCSKRCARQSQNQRYYLAHKTDIIKRILRNQQDKMV